MARRDEVLSLQVEQLAEEDDPWQRFADLHERARRAVATAQALRERGYAASRLKVVVDELERVTQEVDGLRVAMQTRATIEQAKGVLMVLHGCGPDDAFALMVRMSQRSQHKLHDVAEKIVAEVVRLPEVVAEHTGSAGRSGSRSRPLSVSL